MGIDIPTITLICYNKLIFTNVAVKLNDVS